MSEKTQKTEENAAEQSVLSLAEQDPRVRFEKLSRGSIELFEPFKSDNVEIRVLDYDFHALTGVEYAEAMAADRDNRRNAFVMTDLQALHLFAAAAAKKTEHVDKYDVLRGLALADTISIVQLTTLFFAAGSRMGEKRFTSV